MDAMTPREELLALQDKIVGMGPLDPEAVRLALHAAYAMGRRHGRASERAKATTEEN